MSIAQRLGPATALLSARGMDWMCGMVDRLRCEECGCVSRGRAEGWAAFLGEDLAGLEPPCIGIFCPRCAGEFFDHRADDARDYT